MAPNAPDIEESKKSYTLDESFAYCAAITEAHYENFPVTSLFLPAEKRPYIQAIYAFSRIADDYADMPGGSAGERLKKLSDWEEKLRQCYDSAIEHPVFAALRESVKKLEIPIEPLLDLLTAFKRDVTQHRYETFDELLSYCKCSANPVGRIVLMIFNYRDDKLFELSDHICTALQLTNFWQDVWKDQEIDRMYLPLADLQTHGYSEELWKRQVQDDNFKRVMKYELERTRDYFYRGAELPSLVSKDLQLELKLVWFGGMEIIRLLERSRFDLMHRRPKLTVMNKFNILLRGLLINDLRYYKKKRPKKELWDLT